MQKTVVCQEVSQQYEVTELLEIQRQNMGNFHSF